MAASVPHSFVLADLFDVQSMTLEIPDHVLENEPGLELVPCPECDGACWLACYGSSPYGDAARAWHRPDLDLVYKPCLRCNQAGEVLDLDLLPGLEPEEAPETVANKLAA